MYRKRRENRRRFLQKITLWHPLILLAIMFVLGACTGRTQETGAAVAANAVTQSMQTAEAAGTTAALKEAAGTTAALTTGAAEQIVKSESSSSQAELTTAAGLTEAAETKNAAAETKPGAAETRSGTAETKASAKKTEAETTAAAEAEISENGCYTSKNEVALYLHLYGHLPSNYITKKKAEERGWDSKKGNLSDILPGMSIGGSTFGNYEGLLPAQKGRKYYECDIDYSGGYRNAKRIIYSNDGLVFYTEDHYKTFEQLY